MHQAFRDRRLVRDVKCSRPVTLTLTSTAPGTCILMLDKMEARKKDHLKLSLVISWILLKLNWNWNKPHPSVFDGWLWADPFKTRTARDTSAKPLSTAAIVGPIQHHLQRWFTNEPVFAVNESSQVVGYMSWMRTVNYLTDKCVGKMIPVTYVTR